MTTPAAKPTLTAIPAEHDFVFLDVAQKPWLVRDRPVDLEGVTTYEPWVWYWSTYQKWVPLIRVDNRFIQEAARQKPMPEWQADLYELVSKAHQ